MDLKTERMQPLVMRTLRKLAEQLRDASATHAPLVPSRHKIDAREAEFSNDGSVIFPEHSDAQNPDWAVFHLHEMDRSGAERTFKLSGTLTAQMPAPEFMANAYTLILMRTIDDDGLRTYSELLRSGRLRRREVLRILAKSNEAQALQRQSLIVPQPSVWLPSGDPQAPPPLLIIGA